MSTLKKLQEAKKEQIEIRSKIDNLKEERNDLVERVLEAEEEEVLEEVEKELKELQDKKQELEDKRADIEEKIKKLEAELDKFVEEDEEDEEEKEEERGEDKMNHNNLELRKATESYIRSYGKRKEGVKTTDVGVLIPKAEAKEVKRQPGVVDLSQFVQRIKVSTGSGSHPVLKRSTSKMVDTEELAKNPALNKPEFLDVDWKVKTYRGSIPVSEEAIQDSEVDLLGIVEETAEQQKMNTVNEAVVAAFKEFKEEKVSDADGLKDVVNVGIDAAYNKRIIASQSFFNEIDKLKDGNGRYLLQDNIAASSGKGILGIPVDVVSDTLFGAPGTAQAFIGDPFAGVLMADRYDLNVRWVEHDIFGRYLGSYTRFDIVQADEDAGVLVTFEQVDAA